MAVAFDTLGYAKKLALAGVRRDIAEAASEAARDYIMAEVATKADVIELKSLIERQTYVMTVRFGAMLVIGVGALATILKL